MSRVFPIRPRLPLGTFVGDVIYTFDGNDKLAGERIYFDRAMILEQMGVPSVGGTTFYESADKAIGRQG